MRVLVTGDRHWDDEYIIAAVLDGFFVLSLNVYDEEFVVIEGGADGADKFAREWSPNRDGVRHITERADWDRYGRAAGPIRNRKMVDEHEPDIFVAFHDDLEKSKGTLDCVGYAQTQGVRGYRIGRM
jgi:hypothetical protein